MLEVFELLILNKISTLHRLRGIIKGHNVNVLKILVFGLGTYCELLCVPNMFMSQ